MTAKEISLDENGFATEDGYITVYNYDRVTREYIGLAVEYLPFGVGVPANSCVDAPGSKKDGFAICRNADSTGWEYIADHRGETVYSTTTGKPATVSQLGEYPEGTTTKAPLTPYDKWDGEKWVTDTEAQRSAAVAAAESQRETRLGRARKQLIVGQTKLLCGRALSNDEQASLNAWLNYTDALNALDFTDINNGTDVDAIDWPVAPDEEGS